MNRPVAVLVFFVSLLIGYNLLDDFDPSKLKGKNVIVTGASSGIGEQMAYHYAQFGANVLITARSEKRLKEVTRRCETLGHSGGKYLYHVADMSDMTAADRLIKDAEDRMGGVDHLVLNHIDVISMGEWIGCAENLTMLRRTMDVNFLSYVHVASGAMRLLEDSRGSIVVVSSVAGRVPQPYIAAYSASKFALEGFFSSLRQELSIRQVDVSITFCIIGLVGTASAVNTLSEHGMDNIVRWIPVARPEDVALAIVKSGTKRAKELSSPYFSVKFFALLNTFAPRLTEALMRFLYAK